MNPIMLIVKKQQRNGKVKTKLIAIKFMKDEGLQHPQSSKQR